MNPSIQQELQPPTPGKREWLAWLPIPLLVTAIATLWVSDLRVVWPLPALNWFIHYGSAAIGLVIIVFAAGRSFAAN